MYIVRLRVFTSTLTMTFSYIYMHLVLVQFMTYRSIILLYSAPDVANVLGRFLKSRITFNTTAVRNVVTSSEELLFLLEDIVSHSAHS